MTITMNYDDLERIKNKDNQIEAYYKQGYNEGFDAGYTKGFHDAGISQVSKENISPDKSNEFIFGEKDDSFAFDLSLITKEDPDFEEEEQMSIDKWIEDEESKAFFG